MSVKHVQKTHSPTQLRPLTAVSACHVLITVTQKLVLLQLQIVTVMPITRSMVIFVCLFAMLTVLVMLLALCVSAMLGIQGQTAKRLGMTRHAVRVLQAHSKQLWEVCLVRPVLKTPTTLQQALWRVLNAITIPTVVRDRWIWRSVYVGSCTLWMMVSAFIAKVVNSKTPQAMTHAHYVLWGHFPYREQRSVLCAPPQHIKICKDKAHVNRVSQTV